MNENSPNEPNLISASFFDDSRDSEEFNMPLWSKKEELEKVEGKMSYLSSEKICSGALITKRKTRDQITQKYYHLYSDRLEAYKVFSLLLT